MAGWIFQANPLKFDVDAYLTTYRDIWWSIRQRHFLSHFSNKDTVFLWRSDGDLARSGGIVAKAEVTGSPVYRADDAREFWLDKSGAAPEWRLPMKVLEIRTGESLIRRTWLETEPDYRDLRILRFRSETNYKLTDAELRRLNGLWEAAKHSSIQDLEADDFTEDRSSPFRHVRRERD
jgi:hypothetical protein